MDHAQLTERCLSLPEAEATRPFGPDVVVFKVVGKMFALVPDNADPPTISLKGDPMANQALRQRFDSVSAGYHLNKQHWNTIECTGEVPDSEMRDLIEDSYDLVVDGLPKKHKLRLQGQVRAGED